MQLNPYLLFTRSRWQRCAWTCTVLQRDCLPGICADGERAGALSSSRRTQAMGRRLALCTGWATFHTDWPWNWIAGRTPGSAIARWSRPPVEWHGGSQGEKSSIRQGITEKWVQPGRAIPPESPKMGSFWRCEAMGKAAARLAKSDGILFCCGWCYWRCDRLNFTNCLWINESMREVIHSPSLSKDVLPMVISECFSKVNIGSWKTERNNTL